MASKLAMEMKDSMISLLDAPLADAVIFGIHIDGMFTLLFQVKPQETVKQCSEEFSLSFSVCAFHVG